MQQPFSCYDEIISALTFVLGKIYSHKYIFIYILHTCTFFYILNCDGPFLFLTIFLNSRWTWKLQAPQRQFEAVLTVLL